LLTGGSPVPVPYYPRDQRGNMLVGEMSRGAMVVTELPRDAMSIQQLPRNAVEPG
jgi:hypothetical protein